MTFHALKNSRRGLPGLDPVARNPQTPLEVTRVTRDGVDHQAARQLDCANVNGVNQWWLETVCGIAVVVTEHAVPPGETTCPDCLAGGGEGTPGTRVDTSWITS